MIIKFILMGSLCWNFPDVGTQCSQFLDMDVKDAAICRSEAMRIGKKHKAKIEELGGFVEEYKVHCMAIDSEGYNIDHSFEISYNIL